MNSLSFEALQLLIPGVRESAHVRPTLMVVAFVRPGLPVAVLKEHLNAAPQQILPARTHRRSQGVLVDLDQFTCRGGRTGGRTKGGQKAGWAEGRKQGDARGMSQTCSWVKN